MSKLREKQWQIDGVANLATAAPDILAFLAEAPPVWRLEGPMGAGKTTLASALGRALGIADTVQSPTFGIVNEYQLPSGAPVYHFDFYRLKNLEEAYGIGIEEYLDSNALCWLEWAEKITVLLPESYTTLFIRVQADNSRIISASYYE